MKNLFFLLFFIVLMASAIAQRNTRDSLEVHNNYMHVNRDSINSHNTRINNEITNRNSAINDTLDYSLRTYAVNLFDYIGAFDTSTSWTSVFQSALTSLAGSGKILYVPGNYKYTLTNAGNNPYAGSHDYCLDLKTGGYTIQGGQGAILYLKDAQQTDASGALDVIVGKTMSNFAMRNLIIIGNTAGQTGWTGGYAQIGNGCVIRIYGVGESYGVNNNLVFDRLDISDHWSNPIDVTGTDNLIISNSTAWGMGEGFEAINCRDVLFHNLNVNDSTDTHVGDGVELSNCINFTVTNCTVKENGAGAAFDLVSSQDGILKDFYIENWANGISAQSSASGQWANNILVTGGVMKNIPGGALESADGKLTYENILIDSAGVSGFQIVVSDSTRLTTQIIKDCIFKRTAGSYIVGNRSLILDNCIFDSTWGNALAISRSFNNAEPEVYITNCIFSNSTQYGITESYGGTDSTFSVQGMVAHNTFRNNGWGDIDVWDSSAVFYSNNSSDTTLNITGNFNPPKGITPLSAYVSSGSELVTIGRGSQNQIITIRFASNITVRDKDDYGSGNINLASNGDYTFQSGDYLTIQYNSTNVWSETARSINAAAVVSYEADAFFSHDVNGAVRKFNPYLENYLYNAPQRFIVSDTNFSFVNNQTDLFNADYETSATISAGDTGKIYINLSGKSEIDSITYPSGYFLIHFFYINAPASVSGDAYYYNGWSAMTGVDDISNSATNYLYKLTTPATNYARQFRIFIVAGASDVYVSEIEYYPLRSEASMNISPVVNKFDANSLYNKLSFKNFNNTEKAYIDSNGNAYFQDLTVVNTITVSDSVVTQSSTTDTLTVNNVSSLAAATATTLNVGTITSTNGRIQPASGGEIELDSLRNRVAKLDTLNYGFSIADVADGSYSTAIFTTMPITVTMVRPVLRTTVDGTEDTAKCNIYFSTDISSGSPSTLWSTDKNVIDSTTGTTYSSFDDATIPAYSWIWLQCNDEVGTVNQLNMTVFARKD